MSSSLDGLMREFGYDAAAAADEHSDDGDPGDDDNEPVPDAYQQAALDGALLRHENVFVTGPAGSGKSFTLRHLVAGARDRALTVSVTSSTGRSAVELALKATTVHGFLALGDTGTRSVAAYVRQLETRTFEPHRHRITHTDVLVIDEVSMLSEAFLTKAEAIVAAIRHNTDEPWGGMQVVFSGDFAQLRPVPEHRRRGKRTRQEPAAPRLAFKARRAWIDAGVRTYNVTELHRQATDTAYGALLDRVRFANPTPDDITALRARIVTPRQAAVLAPTSVFLYPRNADVDEHNRGRLEQLDEATAHEYHSTFAATVKLDAKRSSALVREAARTFVESSMRALPVLELRQGCRVLLLANLDVAAGLANGCTGTVVGFSDAGLPYVEFDRGRARVLIRARRWAFDDPEFVATYDQVPLMLAWATSIHRSQGLTLDSIVADVSAQACFAAGMAYVVMSRVRSLEGLHMSAFSSAAICADPEACSFYGIAA